MGPALRSPLGAESSNLERAGNDEVRRLDHGMTLQDAENLLALLLAEPELIALIGNVARKGCAGLGILCKDSECLRHGCGGQTTIPEHGMDNLFPPAVQVIVAYGQNGDAPRLLRQIPIDDRHPP